MDPVEFARLEAVEAAVRSLVETPGRVTKTEIRQALATVAPDAPGADDFSDADFSSDFE